MKTKARIYQPSRNTMQSGRAGLKEWILEYETETPRKPEPLMGWVSSGDTLNQVEMSFATKEDAIMFAERRGLLYTITENHERRVRPRSYADNFKYEAPVED